MININNTISIKIHNTTILCSQKNHIPVPKETFQIHACRKTYSYQSLLLLSSLFSHPDYTVGFGISPNRALRLAGCTAGRESHPASKNIQLCFIITQSDSFVKDYIDNFFTFRFLSNKTITFYFHLSNLQSVLQNKSYLFLYHE